MTENPLLTELKRRKVDARYSSNGHYCAATRYQKYSRYLGSFVTPIVAITTSSVFVSLSGTDNDILRIILGIISLLATILVSIQQFTSFDEKSKNHQRSGDLYLSMFKRIRLIEVKYNAEKLNDDDVSNSLDLINEQYNQITRTSPLIPSQDYECAKKNIEEGAMNYTEEELAL